MKPELLDFLEKARQHCLNPSILPDPALLSKREHYCAQPMIEYRQCVDEGKDVAALKPLFEGLDEMPDSLEKEQLAYGLFEEISAAEQRRDYPYTEPSDLEDIRQYNQGNQVSQKIPTAVELKEKIHGAWMGRIIGCMAGKPIEGIYRKELIPFLKEIGNYPFSRYILRKDLNDELCAKYKFDFNSRKYPDECSFAISDDDTNYTVLGWKIIDKFGRDFTTEDVGRTWIYKQPKYAYCTAELVAFLNVTNGYRPPHTATRMNPYRERIGAQIRADYYGYINPGNPGMAAEMAWRDASLSHVKNGIYGAMWVAAMLAQAAVSNDIKEIILTGLREIPAMSRLYESIISVIARWEDGADFETCMSMIYDRWDDEKSYDWCHTIPNAQIVAAALLYGDGDFAQSICLAVQSGFDTDCNGATVGSIVGLINGAAGIPEEWAEPIHNKLETTIFGIGTVAVDELVEKTMRHLPN